MSNNILNKSYVPAIESQQIFFDKITRNKLNELLNRFRTGYLQKQINNILVGYYCKVRLSDDCEAYITFYRNSNKDEIGHISFHLSKQPSEINNKYIRHGRLHIVNKSQKYYTLRVKNRNDLFELVINSPLQMSSDLQYCVDKTLELLNDYTNTQKNLPIHLQHYVTPKGQSENECLLKVANIKERHKYRTTRKQSQTKVIVPKAPKNNPWQKKFSK